MTTQIAAANLDSTLSTSLVTLDGVQTLFNKTVRGLREYANYLVVAGATGTLAIPATTPISYYTVNSTGNFVFNVTGLSSLSALAYAESITIAVFITNGATGFYMTGLQVDGASVTPKYQGGAPSSGVVNGVDQYTITIMKDYSGTYFYRAFVTRTSFV
jgi:hypothetical protein